jgi:hypothetical protein
MACLVVEQKHEKKTSGHDLNPTDKIRIAIHFDVMSKR